MERKSRKPAPPAASAASTARKPAVLSERINTAINGLIRHFVPEDPNEDEATAQRRQEYCFHLVRSTLETSMSSDLATDVNHTMDLIRKKLTVDRPNDAWRFSQLYSRLLALPVLNQKWAILYMLYQLADSTGTSDPMRPLLRLNEEQAAAETRPLSSLGPRLEQEVFDDAFARGGLKRFPPDKARRGPEEAAAAAEIDPAVMLGPAARDVALKSTLLADSPATTEPSETTLLRDLPFTLQGLDSATMVFRKEVRREGRKENSKEVAVLVLPATLPVPIVSLLHTLAEPALLYRGLDEFVRSPAKGLLGQSLRAAISTELRAYLGLVATLESQIRRALATLDTAAPRSGIGRAGVTLKRCVVWTREATMGLRLMSLIAEESGSKRGGQLISLIHRFSTSHGDPTVGAFAERLLGPVARPFYNILRRWIYDGELADPYREFFVREQGTGAEDAKRQEAARAKGHSSVWNDKYEIDAAMIPSIMAAEFAEKVFLIGKSLNFLRHSCGDAQWVDDYSKGASKELRYGDTATLEAWIDEAYKTTMRRLMQLLTDKFRLFDHLAALKKYVLLGQGDFVALLMESLAPNLDRPATAQYRHTLTSQLDHAIQGSNARFEPIEILRRLDARMLQQSHGDTGWDCFTLEYKIGAPVDCVVTEWASKQYLKVFNFLWHVKRVEFALASTWHKCMTGARGVLQTDDEAVHQTWKTTRGTLAEMVHLVGQLQYYILFEVIEASWEALQAAIRRDDCTLDDLITAHTAYLTSITHKGLLGVRRRAYVEMKQQQQQQATMAAAAAAAAGAGESASSALPPSAADPSAEDANGFPSQLKELLRTMLAFRDAVDGLYSWAVSDFTRRQEADVLRHRQTPASARINANINMNTSHGDDWDDPTPPVPPAPTVESELPALQQRLLSLSKTFRKRVIYLLADLGYQKDADLRFLGVAMNFNDVYVVPQGKRHQPKR
ncbi:spindle pole body component [Grosmannia clavigera kw1407]|uniref:Spindle pole body component n=1 Tax=Grosmannia clavigera (strain kw1407 / UAMH 11150) TaxID=655863 RepID=F0XGS4_GROCL|nr:spindle pole body component [Grosmannia clavigera kw1407]EFX02902.1 spindle pole body component [Grosmannia clavigera kw1407]